MVKQIRTPTAALAMSTPLLQWLFPEVIWAGDGAVRQVALSYDDGPDPHDTPELLTVLAQAGVPATFCLLGERVAANATTVRAMAAAGHQIGLHGYRHHSFLRERPTLLAAQLALTQRLIAELSGRPASTLRLVRPPYGHFSPRLLRRFGGWGYQPLIGSLMPLHWRQPMATSLHEIATLVRPGALLILHEGLGVPPIATLTAQIIQQLQAEGYRFVTVDELMWKQ